MTASDNNNKNELLDISSSGTEMVIRRLKEALAVNSDGQLATCLGISRQNIGAARKRDSVPAGWIHKVAELTGCSMDWLGFGSGPKEMRAEYTASQPVDCERLASPQAPYHRSDGPVSCPGDDRAGVAGFGEAVEMLATIYQSKDRELIRAISANIRAFFELTYRKGQDQQ